MFVVIGWGNLLWFWFYDTHLKSALIIIFKIGIAPIQCCSRFSSQKVKNLVAKSERGERAEETGRESSSLLCLCIIQN